MPLENTMFFYTDYSVILNILVKKQTSALQAFNDTLQGPQYAILKAQNLRQRHHVGHQHVD